MDDIKRKVGIAGAIVIASQGLTSFYSSKTVSGQVDDLKSSFQKSQVEREQYFVRKTEFEGMAVKLDKLTDQIISLREQISTLRIQIENKYSLDECDPLVEDLKCDEVASRD